MTTLLYYATVVEEAPVYFILFFTGLLLRASRVITVTTKCNTSQ